jgi:hypothetical protein
MSSAVTCYFCEKDVPDNQSRDANYLTGDGGSICDKCVKA